MIIKQKLELTWMGKETRPRLVLCILLEDAANSCHARTASPAATSSATASTSYDDHEPT